MNLSSTRHTPWGTRLSRGLGRGLSRGTLALVSAASLVLVACGGGDDPALGNNTPATPALAERATAFEAGTITGFGSIIVNGVRYDDSSATVSDESGAALDRSALGLGMSVEVDGAGVDRSRGLGRALHIRMGSSTVGPVQAVNAAAGTLTVLGQAVTTSSSTVFGAGLSAGLQSLVVGSSVVEVHALFDASTGAYAASRLALKPGAGAYRLRGLVSALNSGAKTFKVNGATVNYNSATLTGDNPLANGQAVRVTLITVPANGQWFATKVLSGKAASATPADDRSAGHVHGAITAFTNSASFMVNDVAVNASKASFPDGTTGLKLGAKVEVEGAVVAGVLVATKVELDDHHQAEGRRQLELHGAITAVNTAARTFTLRGVTVSVTNNTVIERGTAAALVVGAKVEVRGNPGADRSTLDAVKIKFED